MQAECRFWWKWKWYVKNILKILKWERIFNWTNALRIIIGHLYCSNCTNSGLSSLPGQPLTRRVLWNSESDLKVTPKWLQWCNSISHWERLSFYDEKECKIIHTHWNFGAFYIIEFTYLHKYQNMEWNNFTHIHTFAFKWMGMKINWIKTNYLLYIYSINSIISQLNNY